MRLKDYSVSRYLTAGGVTSRPNHRLPRRCNAELLLLLALLSAANPAQSCPNGCFRTTSEFVSGITGGQW